MIDAKTKQAIHLTPHDEATQYSDVNFLSNDEIIFGTNQNGEFITLCQMDWRTKKISGCSKENWDLDSTAISNSGEVTAWTINKEGFSEFYINKISFIKDRRFGELPEPSQIKLPAKGIVGGLEFSKDGSKLAFTFSSARYNTDIWIYDLNAKTLTQVTKSSRVGIPQSSFVEPELVKYKTFDGREIPAWYYKPQPSIVTVNLGKNNISQTEKIDTSFHPPNGLPVIVSVHGGPEGQERPGFNPLYQYYLSRGYAILATNVSGSTGYGKTYSHLDDVRNRENSVRDLAHAVEWLKTSGGADAKRIAVMGGSYGGYMTLAAITLYPDLWAAAVDTVGIGNWETFLKNTSGYRRRQREVEYGMLDKDIDFLRRISPIYKVGKIKTPLFVIHGKNDPRVPYTEAEQIVESLKKRGATVEYKLFADEGHGVAKLKNRLELYPLVADFLDKYMK
ncbi:MAG: S9 family peptidase [Acidobacteria bacterium]|nr:S9 family peptidase [Acidobacteriota bacterium]